MKFQYSGFDNIIISLKFLLENQGFLFIKKFNNIFLFIPKNELVISKLKAKENVICYLDKFIILLPESYTEQNQLWQDFYKLFGNEYETLVNKENNKECIELMLNVISVNKKNCKILDFGCGSGLSYGLNQTGKIFGYEPVSTMKYQAQNKGMTVFDSKEINQLPNEFFDAVFSSYVFHMGIVYEDIERIVPKLKQGGIWLANFYKEINLEAVNKIFSKLNFIQKKILTEDGRFGSVYEYRKQ